MSAGSTFGLGSPVLISHLSLLLPEGPGTKAYHNLVQVSFLLCPPSLCSTHVSLRAWSVKNQHVSSVLTSNRSILWVQALPPASSASQPCAVDGLQVGSGVGPWRCYRGGAGCSPGYLSPVHANTLLSVICNERKVGGSTPVKGRTA